MDLPKTPGFEPLTLMINRVERYGSDSDGALLAELLYLAEFILKSTAATFIAAIDDDRENHRYKLIHALIRADGIGTWSQVLDEALTGPASQHLASGLSDVRRAFTERVGKGGWQNEAVRSLHDCLRMVTLDVPPLAEKVALRNWFQYLSEFRNKTRGHGATTPETARKAARSLLVSLKLIIEHSPIFKLSWAYLHRNLSGKYRVVGLGGEQQVFENLKKSLGRNEPHYTDGVYVFIDKYRRVELIFSDGDSNDFFFPNGAFRGDSFELHSLITDSRQKGDATPYLAPASDRPPSETEGRASLDLLGHVFTNLPVNLKNYVDRPKLEEEVHSVLVNDRHPIVTLVGRGGIGKTSLALKVLYEIAHEDRFGAILWFSARDIDLVSSGPKLVRPKVLTDKDISDDYIQLVRGLADLPTGKFNTNEVMQQHLRLCPLGPTLFVFDNFETSRAPIDLFNWIDMNIRLPNKVMITSRFREFKADFPIDVFGMEKHEAELLVEQCARELGIEALIGTDEKHAIIEESNGHPYVIKVIMGQIADSRKFVKPSVIIARKDDILDALFERTFANLSPMAVRVFLTLCGWRSLVPQLAVEAVMLRSSDGESDPAGAVDLLVRMSLIERKQADDGSEFLSVPLAAALFGRRKLDVSPYKSLIEADIRFIQDVGATSSSSLRSGLGPKIDSFFKKVAVRVGEGNSSLDEMRPVLEFLARGFPPAWLLLADIEQEVNGVESADQQAEYVRRYLESKPGTSGAQNAWSRLIRLYRIKGDVIGGCGAFLKAAEISEPPLGEISSMVNYVNNSPLVKAGIDVAERRSVLFPLARLFEERIALASATDLSRLAWLFLHIGDEQKAIELAKLGLSREEDNIYCQRLVAKLSV